MRSCRKSGKNNQKELTKKHFKMEKKAGIFNSFIWKFLERILAQGVSFVVSVILARILLPEAYGMVAVLLIFINIANVFVVDGFGTALVQRKDPSETDYSTMFFLSLFIALLLYVFLFFLAKPIASFYKMESLVWPLRVIALKLLIASFNSIQHSYVQKNMLFRKFFWSTLIGTVVSGFLGIFLAYNGFGVWALVFQYLTNSLMDTIVLFFTVQWKPKMLFSWKSAKDLMRYGWKITLGSLFNEIYTEARSLIIGKKYSSEDLAYYNKGKQFPSLFTTNINSTISSVLFPVLSDVSDDKRALKERIKKSLRLSCYIIFPIMVGLAVVAEPLVNLLLTDKWSFCVPFLQIACICQAMQPINTANLQLIKASGRGDVYLRNEILKKTIGIALIVVSMWFGVYAIALSEIAVVFICNVINIFPNKKLADYGYKEQFLDIMPAFWMSLVMGIPTYLMRFIIKSDWILLTVQVLMGVTLYILLSVLTKNDSWAYLKNKVFSVIRRKNDF